MRYYGRIPAFPTYGQRGTLGLQIFRKRYVLNIVFLPWAESSHIYIYYKISFPFKRYRNSIGDLGEQAKIYRLQDNKLEIYQIKHVTK
jgi:hypothetical protein